MPTNETNDSVARGAALLDAQQPGWLDKINLDTLNITSPSLCILGQVYADNADEDFGYDAGIQLLNLTFCRCCPKADSPGSAGAHGFDGASLALREAWGALVTARRTKSVQMLLEDGWLLSRDSLSVISPATGREVPVTAITPSTLADIVSSVVAAITS